MSVSSPAARRSLAACALFALAGSAYAEDTGLGTKEDQKNLIAGICATQLDLDAAGCTCLAGRALEELDDPQRAYLILSVVQPPAAERLPIANSKEELAVIFNFLGTARTACGGNPVSPPTAKGSDLAQ